MKLEFHNEKVTLLMRIIRTLKEMDYREMDYPTEVVEDLFEQKLDFVNCSDQDLVHHLMLAIVELTY